MGHPVKERRKMGRDRKAKMGQDDPGQHIPGRPDRQPQKQIKKISLPHTTLPPSRILDSLLFQTENDQGNFSVFYYMKNFIFYFLPFKLVLFYCSVWEKRFLLEPSEMFVVLHLVSHNIFGRFNFSWRIFY